MDPPEILPEEVFDIRELWNPEPICTPEREALPDIGEPPQSTAAPTTVPTATTTISPEALGAAAQAANDLVDRIDWENVLEEPNKKLQKRKRQEENPSEGEKKEKAPKRGRRKRRTRSSLHLLLLSMLPHLQLHLFRHVCQPLLTSPRGLRGACHPSHLS